MGVTDSAKGSSVKEIEEGDKMSGQTKVEVTRGVFDPRTYKQVDKENWARKRKPEWMATTGKIHYVRERTVESQERELEEQRKKEAEKTAPPPSKEIVREPPTEVPIKTNVERKEVTSYWPRKMRSDITRSRVV